MTIDLDALEKLADEATPGPWVVQDSCSWRRIGTRQGDGDVLCPTRQHRDNHPDLMSGRGQDVYANLNFIAAANPQAVKALIVELKEARGLLKSWVGSAEAEYVEGLFYDDVKETRALLAKAQGGE